MEQAEEDDPGIWGLFAIEYIQLRPFSKCWAFIPLSQNQKFLCASSSYEISEYPLIPKLI